MISFKNQINWLDPLTNLTRFNQTIFGLNSHYEMIQIDVRNHVQQKVASFLGEDYQFPTIHSANFLKTIYGNTYYFSFDKKIINVQGQIIDESNSKADFCKGLDGKDDFFIFGKFHKLHQKYSLNALRIGRQKKIIKLYDQAINRMNLIVGQNNKSAIVQMIDQTVQIHYGEDWQTQQTIPRANRYLIDSDYVYTLSAAQFNSPKRNSQYNSPQLRSEIGKVRVQAFDKNNILKGKGYSSFQFNLPKYPIKIDSFQTDLIIAFDNSLQIYDIRKITKPFQKENQKGIKDFYYEPNLQRIFLSCQKSLNIYQYK